MCVTPTLRPYYNQSFYNKPYGCWSDGIKEDEDAVQRAIELKEKEVELKEKKKKFREFIKRGFHLFKYVVAPYLMLCVFAGYLIFIGNGMML